MKNPIDNKFASVQVEYDSEKLEAVIFYLRDKNQKQTAAHQKSRVSAVAVTRLFRNLCGIFQGKLDDENRQTIHQSAVDRRIRREDEAKRNAELTYD